MSQGLLSTNISCVADAAYHGLFTGKLPSATQARPDLSMIYFGSFPSLASLFVLFLFIFRFLIISHSQSNLVQGLQENSKVPTKYLESLLNLLSTFLRQTTHCVHFCINSFQTLSQDTDIPLSQVHMLFPRCTLLYKPALYPESLSPLTSGRKGSDPRII